MKRETIIGGEMKITEGNKYIITAYSPTYRTKAQISVNDICSVTSAYYRAETLSRKNHFALRDFSITDVLTGECVTYAVNGWELIKK